MTPTGQIDSTASPARNKPSPKMITAGVLVVLIVLFAIANSQTVTIHWWFITTTQTPMIVVIAGCGLIGFAVGWMFARRRAASRGAPR